MDFEPLPLGVIVTVAGTGSECNGGAVITNEEKKIKTGRDYPKLNPRFALMDPTYLQCPRKGADGFREASTSSATSWKPISANQ